MGRRVQKIEGVQPGPRPGTFRIRGEYVDGKTGRRREIDRIVIASSPIEAASIRARLLAEAVALRGERRPERTTLADALDAWRKGKALELRPSTAGRYDVAIGYWKAAIGAYFVERVDPDDVRGVLAGWREIGLATETINGRLRVLRSFAIETRNRAMVEGVRALESSVEESEANEDEGRGLDEDELRRLLAAGPTAPLVVEAKREKPRKRPIRRLPKWWPRAWALVATLAWTGARFGEATALRWEDVDLDAATMRIRRAQWRGIVGHPKARASKRTIALPEPLVEVLREHRATMLREQLPGVDSALVFPSRIRGATFVSNTHARKAMLTVCAAAGVDLGDRPALHTLRHALNNIVRRVASEEVRRSLIGHAEEVATYTHVELHEQRAAMGAVVRLVRGGA
jgi:integrase